MLETDTVSDKTSLQNILEAIDFRLVQTRQELEKAYSLVYKEYLKRKYVCESDCKLKLSLYNALNRTTTFVALLEKEIFSTATLIPDSPLGLPMEEIYHDEVNQLRAQNKKFCEISMLASETELFKNGISMMLNSKKMFLIFYLFKLIFDYAKDVLKLDYICITINPKHALTYDFLLFKDLGGLKTYEKANGAPAVAKYLDLNTVETECKTANMEGLYRMFFMKKNPPEKFAQKFTFTPQDLRYFFVDKTDIFKNASPKEMKCIKECYPSYDFSRIIK